MSESVALCTHIKTDGIVCGSPAVSGTELCYHHSAVKTALGKVQSPNEFGVCPIPFVFPEDRASMQINFFLLLTAFNEGRIDVRTYNCMLSMLRSMARNLGKSGSLVEETSDQGEASDQQSAVSVQENASGQRSAVSDQGGSDPTSQRRDPSAGSGQAVGHPPVGHTHTQAQARTSLTA
ncbi:MAG: hypothetical protein WBD10_16780 [Acidobacteriaceae bacterium]